MANYDTYYETEALFGEAYAELIDCNYSGSLYS